jgi:MFS family permease
VRAPRRPQRRPERERAAVSGSARPRLDAAPAEGEAAPAAGETAAALRDAPSPVPGISRNVFWLGITSFCTDISSEMVYPLVPVFVTAVVGAPVFALGVIEGVAEGTASLLKLASGWLSDRWGRRRPLVLAGYGLSATAKPLLAVARVWGAVLFARFVDRFGKGIRTAARDALIADSAPVATRGRAFGFHRSADTAGAVLGPLLALPLLAATHDRLRVLFVFAAVPAALGLAALLPVRDRPRLPVPARLALPAFAGLGAPARRYLLALGAFAVANSSDTFIILRGRGLGLSLAEVVLAYAAYNLVYSMTAMPAGILSDRVGRRRIVIGGLAFFAAVYLGFALARAPWQFWGLLAVYGIYMGLADGATRAYAVDLAPAAARGTVLGWSHMVGGIGAVAASAIAGGLWTWVAPQAAFLYGAAGALGALLLLIAWPPEASASSGNG